MLTACLGSPVPVVHRIGAATDQLGNPFGGLAILFVFVEGVGGVRHPDHSPSRGDQSVGLAEPVCSFCLPGLCLGRTFLADPEWFAQLGMLVFRDGSLGCTGLRRVNDGGGVGASHRCSLLR